MVHETVGALPGWLAAGMALGGVLAVLIAGVFLAGTRLFPDPPAQERTDGGEDRRRAEIREYLLAIDERFVEDRDLAGAPVAFYLPERDVAITFDAHHYFSVDRTDTHAILAEYEMPGHGIGRRLPFETPDPVEALPGEPDEDALTVLGLDTPASAEEVRTAYRERVKEVHPDQGGDPESFEEVQEAYAVAKERAR